YPNAMNHKQIFRITPIWRQIISKLYMLQNFIVMITIGLLTGVIGSYLSPLGKKPEGLSARESWKELGTAAAVSSAGGMFFGFLIGYLARGYGAGGWGAGIVVFFVPALLGLIREIRRSIRRSSNGNMGTPVIQSEPPLKAQAATPLDI